MKATHSFIPETQQEADFVKLSENEGKHTGPEELVQKYKKDIFKTALVGV